MRQKPATTSAGVKSPKTVQPHYNYKWYDPITNDYVEIGDQIQELNMTQPTCFGATDGVCLPKPK